MCTEQEVLKDRETVLYDSRGHGDSTGWDNSPAEDFTWEAMQKDVLEIADAYGFKDFAVGGNSMTTATAVFTAMQNNPRIKAYVFCRAPTAGETREARREQLLEKANSEEGLKKTVLTGAALSNLPPMDDIQRSCISVPTLLLSTEGDAVHPVETAEALNEAISSSSLMVFPSADDIDTEFPTAIAGFLQEYDIAMSMMP